MHIDHLDFDEEDAGAGAGDSADVQNILEEIDLDEITPEEFTELMKNPKLAALFANANGMGFISGQEGN